MVDYICFKCKKEIDSSLVRTNAYGTRVKIRCPYCGGKILFKKRNRPTIVKAR